MKGKLAASLPWRHVVEWRFISTYSQTDFPPPPFIHSPFFDWICSRMSPRIKQDASQIHIEHGKDEVWEPWSTLNHRLCHKPIPSMWQWTRYWFQTLSVIQCWRWVVFCLQLHDSATQHILLEVPKPKNNIQRYSATYYQHWHSWLPFFFSYICTEVLLILWCWLSNFISIKKTTHKITLGHRLH